MAANPNVNVIVGMSVATQDLLAQLQPTTITRTVQGLTIPAQFTAYEGALPVPLVATGNLVPNAGATPASVVLVRNIGPAIFQFNVTFAIFGAAAFSATLQPAGFFFYVSNPVGTAGLGNAPGIINVSVQQSTATNSIAEVFIAV